MSTRAGTAGRPRALGRIAGRRGVAESCVVTDGIVDFPTVVQPVLDKYCVRCHAGRNPAAA